jgi:single-strand DNA-binding protein
MNIVILKGNVASDIESKEVTANGRTTSVVNFRLAVNRYFTKADGVRDKDTTFVSCEAWDTGAETIKKVLSKGDPVNIEGSLKSESWEQDGQKRSRIKIRVNRFERLERKHYEEEAKEEVQSNAPDTSTSTPTPEPVVVGAPEGTDIPF